jgi:energy-coupling factor transport system permease protein
MSRVGSGSCVGSGALAVPAESASCAAEGTTGGPESRSGRRGASAKSGIGDRIGLLLYRPQASPLHATRAGVAALWALALTAATLLLYHPLGLLALLLALLGAGWGAGVGRELARALRTALLVGLPIVAINVLVDRNGLTVFARLGDLGPFGQGDLTVEALVYGAVIALKVAVLVLIAALASLAIDPDALLRIFRRLSFRSALTASLAVRMIPVLAADAQRLAEAQRTRPEGGLRGARGRVALLGAVLAGSLDRAMDVAATLELRGFAAAPRAPRLQRPWSRHDLAFAASAAAILALALLARLGGAASFTAYPLVRAPVGLGLLALCAALILAALLPFGDRRGIAP